MREWRPQFPGTWELAAYEATILRDTGRIREAVAVVQEYARDHWWHLPSQLGTAAMLREAGDYESALVTARRAQRLDIRGSAAFDETARNEMALGRLAEALESQAEAVARAPRNGEYLDFFAVILHSLGREQEAQATRQRAGTLIARARHAML
jgi:tetratricopeptide (TPR) repeat protein